MMNSASGFWQSFSERAEKIERQWPIDRLSFPGYALICALFAIDVVGIWATHFTITWDYRLHLFALACWVAVLGLLARVYGHNRVATALEAIAIPLIGGSLTVLFTVLLCGVSGPLTDATLARADEAIGIDWLAVLRFYILHPSFAAISEAAYNSFGPQLLGVPLVFALLGQRDRTWRFLSAYGIGAVIASLMLPAFPAAGPYVHYGISPAGVPFQVSPWIWEMGPTIEALRAGHIRNILDATGGLVTFPSFHATAGILYIWATWRWWPARLVFVPLNAALILAAPIGGPHYFVDLIGGVILAVIAIWLANLAAGPPRVNER